MKDHPLQRVTILGAILHRCSSAPGDIDRLLIGRISLVAPSSLSDDHSSNTSSSPALVAAVSDFFTFGTTASVDDSAGRLNGLSLRGFLHLFPSLGLLAWFSARRRSSPRPSLREFAVSRSLSSKSQLSFPVDGDSSSKFFPSIFLLLTTPFPDQQTLLHSHDYRTFQFQASNKTSMPNPST